MKNLFLKLSGNASPLLGMCAVASASLLLAAPSLSAQVNNPLLEFNFNGTGTTEISTGSNEATGGFFNSAKAAADLHSADGTGLSGLSGDRAFDNTASNQMGGTSGAPGSGGLFRIDNAHGALSAFTISGWYKSDAEFGNNARLTTGSINIDAPGNRGLRLDITGIGAVEVLRSATGNVYNQAGTWTFFAISYEAGVNGQDNVVNFYAGASDKNVSLVTTLVIASTDNNVVAASNLILGNNGSYNRPFDGLMDNFRLWDSVLDLDDLKLVRSADMQNSPLIPEASTYALMAGFVALSATLILGRRKRKSVA